MKVELAIYLLFIILSLSIFKLHKIENSPIESRWKVLIYRGLPAIFMVVFMWIIADHFELFSDFNVAYYPAGRLIIEDPPALYAEDDLKNILGFVNIPIIALLFTPFSFLSLTNAHLLLIASSSIAVFISCYLLIKLTKVSDSRQIKLIALFIINGPLYYSLRQGNSTHIVLLLLIMSFFCIRSKREILLGTLLAIAALVKIPLFLLGVYYFMRGRWQVVIGFGATLLAIIGTSLLLFGFDSHMAWFQNCIEPYAGKPMAAFNVQSVDGFLARLLTDASLTVWIPVEVSLQFKIIRYVLLSLLVGIPIWICWRSKTPNTLEVEYLEISIALCLALIISPISWTHYYLFLIPSLALYLGNWLAVPQKRLWFNLILLSTLLVSLPVRLVVQPPIPILNILISKLLISHYFLGGVLLLGTLLAARWQTAKHDRLSPYNP